MFWSAFWAQTAWLPIGGTLSHGALVVVLTWLLLSQVCVVGASGAFGLVVTLLPFSGSHLPIGLTLTGAFSSLVFRRD